MRGNEKTSRASGFSKFLSELGGGDSIDRRVEFELILGAKIERAFGDARGESTRTLIRVFNKFVLAMTRRYRGLGLDDEDLFQAGLVGLHEAIVHFDATRGTRLTTYASYWVRAKVREELIRGGRNIHLPADYIDEFSSAERFVQRELARTGKRPGDRAIAKAVGSTVARVLDVREMRRVGTTSLETPAQDGDARTLADLVCTEDEEETDLERRLLDAERRDRIADIAAEVLRPVELAVIRCRFVEDLTLEETAPRIREHVRFRRVVTRERVRQIEELALCKLKYALAGKGIA